MVNEERYRVANGDMIIYKITEILDYYDFGGTTSTEPGEYVVEAKILKEVAGKKKGIVTSSDIIDVMQEYFDWEIRSIFKLKYEHAARKISHVIEEYGNK